MTRGIFTLMLCLLTSLPQWVQAQIVYSCSFSITDVNFGSVDTLSGAAVDTTAQINGTCVSNTLLATVRVRICPGLNSGLGNATSNIRQMRNEEMLPLQYNFYQDPARSIPWGSAQQPALGGVPPIDIAIPARQSTSFSRTVYARVSGNQQNVTPGMYTSSFPTTETFFSHDDYVNFPHDCNTHTQFPTATSPFTVRANVASNCLVTAQNINFGSHGVLDADIDGVGELAVTCSPRTNYSVALSNGLNGTGPENRRMVLGAQSVTYGLYRDAARSQPWGTSAGQMFSGTGTGAVQNVPVYGRVSPQPSPAPGIYTDTVIVTVTY